jgi:hypothetical protein
MKNRLFPWNTSYSHGFGGGGGINSIQFRFNHPVSASRSCQKAKLWEEPPLLNRGGETCAFIILFYAISYYLFQEHISVNLTDPHAELCINRTSKLPLIPVLSPQMITNDRISGNCSEYFNTASMSEEDFTRFAKAVAHPSARMGE